MSYVYCWEQQAIGRACSFSVEVVKHLVLMCTDGSDVFEAVPVEGYRGKLVF